MWGLFSHDYSPAVGIRFKTAEMNDTAEKGGRQLAAFCGGVRGGAVFKKRLPALSLKDRA